MRGNHIRWLKTIQKLYVARSTLNEREIRKFIIENGQNKNHLKNKIFRFAFLSLFHVPENSSDLEFIARTSIVSSIFSTLWFSSSRQLETTGSLIKHFALKLRYSIFRRKPIVHYTFHKWFWNNLSIDLMQDHSPSIANFFHWKQNPLS